MLLSGFTLTQTLAQSFPTALNEVWATTLENTAYSGFAFTAKRADNSASFNIPFAGKHADPTAASNFSGTTALVTTIYGQINGLNATAMVGSAVEAFIDTDGYWSFGNTPTATTNSPGLVVADNALVRPTNPHLFMLTNPGRFLPQGGPPYVGQGLLIEYGGTGAFYSVGRYGFGFGIQQDLGFCFCQNGAAPGAGFEGTIQFTLGEAHVQAWHVWDFSTSTIECRFDAGFYEINPASANANITYPANTQLNLMSDFDGNFPYQGSWRLIALYAATQSSTTRNNISSFILNDGTTVTPLPLSFTDSDGFTYAPNYFPNDTNPLTADLFGLKWSSENGGYSWPSFGAATNLTNSASANLVRFECHQNDNDVYITGAQRDERGAYDTTSGNPSIAQGGTLAIFAQFLIEPGTTFSTTAGDWGFIFQLHYGATVGNPQTADLVGINIVGTNLQVFTQSSSGGNFTNPYNSALIPFTRGVWYAFLYRVTWSTNGTSDKLDVYLDVNGTNPLSHVTAVGPTTLYDHVATVGYSKQGIYTGEGGDQPNIAIRIANHQVSTTLTAFDTFITSQPALPSH